MRRLHADKKNGKAVCHKEKGSTVKNISPLKVKIKI